MLLFNSEYTVVVAGVVGRVFVVPANPVKFPAMGIFGVDVFDPIVAVDVVYGFLAGWWVLALGFAAHSLEMAFDSAETAGGVHGFTHLNMVFRVGASTAVADTFLCR